VTLRIDTVAEQPELLARRAEIASAWAEFMYHDPVSNRRWRSLYKDFPACQFFLLDGEEDRVIGEGNSIPVPWGPAELPEDGWRRALEDGFAGRPAIALSAIAIVVAPDRRGEGLSRILLERMRSIAAAGGFADLVAPVRPSWKARYPLTPIERYVSWRSGDGLPFDPWLRVHARAGARFVAVAPRSMEIPGTIAEWEEWAGMPFPESGSYVVPGALVPVEIDVEADRGLYVEPNVWMHHSL
jgi:GNAT superfamily N-acetyltransferase